MVISSSEQPVLTGVSQCVLLPFFTSVLDCMIVLFNGFTESYKISSHRFCDLLEGVILLTVKEAPLKRCSLVLEECLNHSH